MSAADEGATKWAIADSTVSGYTMDALVDGKSVVVKVARELAASVSVGDQVLLEMRSGVWWVTRFMDTSTFTQPNSDPLPDPQGGTRAGALVCAPVSTGTYSGGWLSGSDWVAQGMHPSLGLLTGCAFYGAKPNTLAGATVTSATARVLRLPGGERQTKSATLWLVYEATRPAGAPSLSGGFAAGPVLQVGEDEHLTIPTAWAQEMVDGTAGGLAIYTASGDYMKTAGTDDWPLAWTLTIDWTR